MRSDDQSSTDNNSANTNPTLSEQDAQAVDRIFEGDPESFVADSDRDHAVLNLFNLLDSPVRSEIHKQSRLDLIGILADRLETTNGQPDAQLSELDQRALDQYIERGYQIGQVESALQSRAAKCDQIAHALAASDSAGDESDLINRTLGKIQAHIDQEELGLSIDNARDGRGGFSIRWSDLISVAAMLLIAGSIIMPIMSGVRSNAQKSICFDNMHASANAFGLYAGSNRDMLPMATAGFGPTWMDVGSTPERSNSSNLFTLVRTHDANLDDLACPSNPNALTGEAEPDAMDWNSLAEVSYSYRIMPPGGMRASSVAQPVRVVLLADRSPVVLRVARDQPIIPEENSPNHQGSGQHMLMLDGSAIWGSTPIINTNDNIWLPRPIERVISQARSKMGIIKGSELPDGPTDAFVGP